MSTFKSNTRTQLTLFEKLNLALVVVDAIRLSLQKFITESFWISPELPSKWVLVQAALLRRVVSGGSVRMFQYGSIPTVELYRKEAAQVGYEYAVDEIEVDGVETRILWVGVPWKKGRKVVLYIHGGGFVMPLSKGHLLFSKWIGETLGEQGIDVAVGILEYTLAPEKTFPRPLHQAVLALNHLLAAECPPADISLVGDSAGAHIELSIISHILHPHPDVPAITPLSSPFAAIILISPWVTFATNSSSMSTKKNIDYITPSVSRYWGKVSIGKGVPEQEAAMGRYHSEVKFAPESWWAGTHNVSAFVGATVGKHEILRDDVVEFYTKLRAGSGAKDEKAQQLFVGEGEIHDGPLIDFLVGRKPSELCHTVVRWLGEGFK